MGNSSGRKQFEKQRRTRKDNFKFILQKQTVRFLNRETRCGLGPTDNFTVSGAAASCSVTRVSNLLVRTICAFFECNTEVQ